MCCVVIARTFNLLNLLNAPIVSHFGQQCQLNLCNVIKEILLLLLIIKYSNWNVGNCNVGN